MSSKNQRSENVDKAFDILGKANAKRQLSELLIPMLEKAYADGVTDFRLSMQGPKRFIVHPMGVNGGTVDVNWDYGVCEDPILIDLTRGNLPYYLKAIRLKSLDSSNDLIDDPSFEPSKTQGDE